MQLTDRDWLEKVRRGARVYSHTVTPDTAQIENFIKWLYEQYGIVYQEDQNDKHI